MHAETPTVERWLDDFFASYYAHRPVNATFIGRHELDHRLPDYSEDGAGDTVADMRGLLDRQPETDSLDVRLASGFLEIQLWEYGSRHFHRGNPSTYTGEAVFGLLGPFLSEYGPIAERVAAAVERMESVAALLQQARDNVREAPGPWTERAIRECRGGLAFLTEGVPMLMADHGIDDGRLEDAARAAAFAFETHRVSLESDVRDRTSAAVACGEEAFSLYLTRGHFVQETADEIARYAEDELARAAAALAEGATDLGASSPAAALAALAELHPTADTYLGRYQATWDEMHRIAEERELLTWPEFPLRYVLRPGWARAAAPDLYFLFYRSPAAFNRPAVHDYLVTPIEPSMPAELADPLLRANNDSVIKLNHVVHHGGIGHQVQNWHAFRCDSRVGRMAAVDCASRIAMFCGGTMAEGWACYATDLMGQVGALTPLEQLAERNGRRRMCARAIVDVRLHHGRMTLEQAADYYVQNAGMSPAAASGEAAKNSMFPGAAVMYLLGTDAIHDLRREMASLEGGAFSLRDFHDEFLSYGSVPVSLIAADMKRKHAHAQR